MKTVLVTNIPAPYRIPVYNLVAQKLGDNFHVIFCSRNEPNRRWELDNFYFNHTFLKENFYISHGASVHHNLEIIKILHGLNPNAVITTGFNPTYLYAWAYALLTGANHIPMTDAWLGSERHLGLIHRTMRKLVYGTSSAFLGASQKSLQLYRSYGVAGTNLFQSCLCIDNDRFACEANNSLRPYDLMFSGRITEAKMPFFFVEVVKLIMERRKAVKVLVVGDGDQRQRFLDALTEVKAEVEYGGFVSQKSLPACYSRAKLLLFTTENDAWGIVANEAMACGTPVLTTPYAGVADELVIDGKNGFVLEPDPMIWAYRIETVLNDTEKLASMRANAVDSVKQFTFENAAQGIISSVNWSTSCRRK